MLNENGVNWSFTIQFLALIIVVSVVIGFCMVVLSGAIKTSFNRKKEQ